MNSLIYFIDLIITSVLHIQMHKHKKIITLQTLLFILSLTKLIFIRILHMFVISFVRIFKLQFTNQ